MSMKRILLSALLLSACSTPPRVAPPSVPEEHAYTGSGETVSIGKRIDLGEGIASDWWALFSSKPLDELIHAAIAGNGDLAAARQAVAQANEAAEASEGGLFPQASVGATAGRQKYGTALFGPANFAIPPFTYYEAGPLISWNPDLFGGTRHAIELQKALSERKAHQLEAAYLILTGNVVSSSLEIASARAELSAIGSMVGADRKILVLVREACRIGSASKADLLEARERLLSDSAMLPPVRQRLASARHRLAVLEGKVPSTWVAPVIDFGDFSLPRRIPVSLPSDLARRRPDILEAQDDLHAARAALGIADADLYPSITLTANMMQEALTPAGLFRSASAAWSMAAGVAAPIFDGGTLSAQRREAMHAYQAALASYRQVVLNSFGDVADALTSLDSDDESVSIMEKEAGTARASADLVLSSYGEGAAGLMQVQRSRREFLNAQLDLIRARHKRYLDCARLLLALGGSPYSSSGKGDKDSHPSGLAP